MSGPWARGRTVALEVVFWVGILSFVVPLVGIFWGEHVLRSRVSTAIFDRGWTLLTPDRQTISKNIIVPSDIRATEEKAGRRSWIYHTDIAVKTLRSYQAPTLVLGRVGDADVVRLNDCFIGSTGISEEGTQEGWWWGALRTYRIPDNCMPSPSSERASLDVHVTKWGGPSYGIFGGPIGIGEFRRINRVTPLLEWFRFNVLALYGFFMIAGVGFYYLFVFLLAPARSYVGVFGVSAVGIGVYQCITSSLPYRLISDSTLVMKINLASAAFTATALLCFLLIRLRIIHRYLVILSAVGSGLAIAIGVTRPTLDTVYHVYETGFRSFSLLT